MAIEAAFMVPHPPLIIPDVGKGGEKQIEATRKAYEQVANEIAKINPETIIISSPHTLLYSDYFYLPSSDKVKGNMSRFGAPNVSFEEEYDTELINEIENISKSFHFPSGKTEDYPLDHGSMVPLYFIRKKIPKCKIVIVGLSGLPLIDNYKFGTIINQAVNNLNRKVVYIASGDLSHKLQTYGPYGFAKEGPIYDERIMNTISKGNFKELLEYDEVFLDKAAECGHRSFTIMAGTLDSMNVKSNFLSHEDITGVGYGICTFYPLDKNDNRNFLDQYLMKEKERIKERQTSNDEYVSLARKTIVEYIKNHNRIEIPDNLPEDIINQKAGVFVSIHKYGVLRGCIGTFLPTTSSIAEEIIQNAISASTKDPRFFPITEEELEYLEINVDILSLPESISSKEQLDPKKYGVIVSSGSKKGLLLPDLEGVDTVEEQISIASRKANIKEGETVQLQRFEVVRHK